MFAFKKRWFQVSLTLKVELYKQYTLIYTQFYKSWIDQKKKSVFLVKDNTWSSNHLCVVELNNLLVGVISLVKKHFTQVFL